MTNWTQEKLTESGKYWYKKNTKSRPEFMLIWAKIEKCLGIEDDEIKNLPTKGWWAKAESPPFDGEEGN